MTERPPRMWARRGAPNQFEKKDSHPEKIGFLAEMDAYHKHRESKNPAAEAPDGGYIISGKIRSQR